VGAACRTAARGNTAFLITLPWDLGPKIMAKFLISWMVTHVLGSRTGMVGRGETTALHPTACPSQICSSRQLALALTEC